MKPIKLIISAFGPYADTMPPIEFEQFEEKGLFLISGDTGAGKTMIFDAICYALFGKTSGQHRSEKNLRSEYASADTKSFVDFYFSHQGKNYHIVREPSYTRVNRNGKLTEEPEKVTFYYEDGRSEEGTKKVAPLVEELLHINEKQFKQIAMIAQGEFWDLLNAKTEKRTEILRTIFQTDAFKNIEYELKDTMNNNIGLRDREEDSILQYFSEVQAKEDGVLAQELQTLQMRAQGSRSAWNVQEFLNVIGCLLDEDASLMEQGGEMLQEEKKILDQKKQIQIMAETNNRFLSVAQQLASEKEKLDAEKEEMDEKAGLLSKANKATFQVYPVFRACQTKEEERILTEQKLSESQKAYDTAVETEKSLAVLYEQSSQQRKQAEEYKAKAVRLLTDEPKYETRAQLIKELGDLQNKAEDLLAQEKRLKKKEEELEERKADLIAKTEALKDQPARKVQLEAEAKTCRDLLGKVSRVVRELLPAYGEVVQSFSSKKENFLKKRELANTAEQKEKTAKDIIDGCRAGILAQDLQDGVPCPVCGSTHHVKLAVLPKDYISEEAYKDLVQKKEEAAAEREKALGEAERAKAEYQKYADYLKQEIIDCLTNEFYQGNADSKTLSELGRDVQIEERELNGHLKKLAVQIKDAEGLCRQAEEAGRSLKLAQGEETKQLSEEKEKFEKEKSRTKEALAAVQAALEPLKKLAFATGEEAVAARKQLQKYGDQILEQIETARIKKEKASLEAGKIHSQIEILKEQARSQKKDEEELKKEFLLVLKENGFENQEEFGRYVLKPERIQDLQQEQEQYRQKVKTNLVQLEDARKNAEGKAYVDLQEVTAQTAAQAEKVDSLIREQNRVANRIDKNRDLLEKIEERKDKLEQYRKASAIAGRLYRLVTGQTGNGKITLEQYIQAAGFDNILRAANRRLIPMSDGQYELRRQEESLGKRSNTFLDLEVFDYYTGKSRPVGNLSGGESFKASLSLALGLSDTVSSQMGGVQMDALFVDEGFGTLDRKSIDSAMEILTTLSNSNKLVGIISHREELMANIPQQILVTKTKTGSQIKIDNGI